MMPDTSNAPMQLGTILSSISHCTYTGCVFSAEHGAKPVSHSREYQFGRFVRIALSSRRRSEETPILSLQEDRSHLSTNFAVGVITKSIQRAQSSQSTRLSTNTQNALFAPDYVAEKVDHLSLVLLGTMQIQVFAQGQQELYKCIQGVPSHFLAAGSVIETMRQEEVRAFHLFAGSGPPDEVPHLQLDYLTILRTLPHTIEPFLLLQILKQVEAVLPEWEPQLSILTRNVSWSLKVTHI